MPSILHSIFLSFVGAALAFQLLSVEPCFASTDEQTVENCPQTPVALLINGLNANRALMLPLERTLESLGLSVSTLLLEGHDSPSWGEPTLSRWIEQVRAARDKLTNCHPAASIIVVGYSLGAAVALLTELEFPRSNPKLLLIAPPLKLTSRASLVRVLTPLTWYPISLLNIALPSFAPNELRAHSGVPVTVYREGIRAIDRLNATPIERFQPLNATVLLTNRDELVSSVGVGRWVTSRNLLWPIENIHVEGRDSDECYAHMFVHPSCHSSESWAEFTRGIGEAVKGLGPGS